jgi:hypothetical protein
LIDRKFYKLYEKKEKNIVFSSTILLITTIIGQNMMYKSFDETIEISVGAKFCSNKCVSTVFFFFGSKVN